MISGFLFLLVLCMGKRREVYFKATAKPGLFTSMLTYELGFSAFLHFLTQFFLRQKFPQGPRLLVRYMVATFPWLGPDGSGTGSLVTG